MDKVFAMFSSAFAVVLAAASMQPSDTTRSSREAYTTCLRTYVQHSIDNRMPTADFATQFPQQCTQQEQAFRTAVIQRESAMRATRSSAEETATLEVDDAKTNFRERYEFAMTPQPH
jgi:hypothetical protein